VTDTKNGVPTHNLEHLSCFLPGLLALGAHTLELSPEIKELHQWAAQGLAYSCYISYADQLSGLGADVMEMKHHNDYTQGRWVTHLEKWKKDGRPGGVPPGVKEPELEHSDDHRDYSIRSRVYLLRPETVESIYLLWRTTGDEKWRHRGWTIFESIERNARTEFGYASVTDVRPANTTLINEMPSFFLAETLKYLYLLFTDEEIVPLDKWVFNTEAHPLPIFNWTRVERQAYHIPT